MRTARCFAREHFSLHCSAYQAEGAVGEADDATRDGAQGRQQHQCAPADRSAGRRAAEAADGRVEWWSAYAIAAWGDADRSGGGSVPAASNQQVYAFLAGKPVTPRTVKAMAHWQANAPSDAGCVHRS